ncbi:HD domain-containing protein [Patescibacteria group bacterium]|nr:HD domain-containing protein [Patescibacteria group bacterium]
MSNTLKFKVPKEVSRVTEELEKADFEAYLVGGCVRDLLREKVPKDWDIATNAKPDEIVELFDDTFYNNEFGTVGVVNEQVEDESLKVIQVTPYRLESSYTDARHPDSVEFGNSLEADLKRRDFTVNALAYSVSQGHLVDLYKGQEDIKDRILRAVGKPDERFAEDALRILRAIRLSAELSFSIERETEEAIKRTASTLEKISMERIRDELSRILMSKRPMEGLLSAQRLGVLKHFIPDLERGIGVNQNQAHKYDVYEHNLRTLQHAADKDWSLDLRLAALFHDISKPETRRRSEEKNDWTFHGHDVVGARLTRKILIGLKYSKKTVDAVVKLVRWHMFFSDPEKITLSAVRRIIGNVGEESIWFLMDLRVCDRVGTGRPKENPYRFRKYKSMVEEALRDPISVGMLKIDGNSLMKITNEKSGPKIGYTLHALLEEVLEDPTLNTKEYLEKQGKVLIVLPMAELKSLGEKGKVKKDTEEEKKVKEIRGRYWVQ